jgi:anti-anti-sigma regulatory factor
MATVVKVFAGEYDLTHQARLRAEFDALRAENSLVLDMSAVTYLDSTFIGELVRLHTMRAEQGCNRLTIVRPASIAQRVLSLLYIFTFCRVVENLDEALAQNGTTVLRNPTPAWISSVLSAVDI